MGMAVDHYHVTTCLLVSDRFWDWRVPPLETLDFVGSLVPISFFHKEYMAVAACFCHQEIIFRPFPLPLSAACACNIH